MAGIVWPIRQTVKCSSSLSLSLSLCLSWLSAVLCSCYGMTGKWDCEGHRCLKSNQLAAMHVASHPPVPTTADPNIHVTLTIHMSSRNWCLTPITTTFKVILTKLRLYQKLHLCICIRCTCTMFSTEPTFPQLSCLYLRTPICLVCIISLTSLPSKSLAHWEKRHRLLFVKAALCRRWGIDQPDAPMACSFVSPVWLCAAFLCLSPTRRSLATCS